MVGEHGNEPSGSINSWIFVDKLSQVLSSHQGLWYMELGRYLVYSVFTFY